MVDRRTHHPSLCTGPLPAVQAVFLLFVLPTAFPLLARTVLKLALQPPLAVAGSRSAERDSYGHGTGHCP
jgi:hypothetical protein